MTHRGWFPDRKIAEWSRSGQKRIRGGVAGGEDEPEIRRLEMEAKAEKEEEAICR